LGCNIIDRCPGDGIKHAFPDLTSIRPAIALALPDRRRKRICVAKRQIQSQYQSGGGKRHS
jgi:hypothetical protein